MLTTKQEIKNWLDEYRIKNYTINQDLSVDVDGSVFLYENHLLEIPVKFNIINGNFYCGYNQLTSTDFFPKEIYGYLNCCKNLFKNHSD
jgi:hypothetical protein